MGILSTLRGEEMKGLIKNARENRSVANKADNNELVWMDKTAKDEIFEMLPQKSMVLIKNLLEL